MKTIAATKFKATCLGVIEEVSRTKRPVLITRYGKPVAQVIPPPAARVAKSWLGCMAGTAKIMGDIVGPVLELEEWEVFRD
jgi:prevent-host-death family protein